MGTPREEKYHSCRFDSVCTASCTQKMRRMLSHLRGHLALLRKSTRMLGAPAQSVLCAIHGHNLPCGFRVRMPKTKRDDRSTNVQPRCEVKQLHSFEKQYRHTVFCLYDRPGQTVELEIAQSLHTLTKFNYSFAPQT